MDLLEKAVTAHRENTNMVSIIYCTQFSVVEVQFICSHCILSIRLWVLNGFHCCMLLFQKFKTHVILESMIGAYVSCNSGNV